MEKPFECMKCNMKFESKKRLDIHSKTHENKKPKKKKQVMPDFDKPDFSQVM